MQVSARSFAFYALFPITALFLAAAPIAAQAAGQDFKVVNKTGYQINEIYVGPHSSRSWGDDIMDDDTVLDDDGVVNVTFARDLSVCRFDIKVVYSDKDESEFRDVDLCKVSKVTLYWNRKAGDTRFVTE